MRYRSYAIVAVALLMVGAAVESAAAAKKPPAAKHVAALKEKAPNDPLWPQQWGLHSAGGAALWKWGHGSPKVVVAVLDTGVDASQPDLRGATVPGWNELTQTANTADDNGHGTLVSGIIAARGGNRIGVAGYCWRCSIMPVKVLDASGEGSGTSIAAGIEWAVAHGADVINMSFTLDHADPAVQAAVGDATARGVLVVASAGNVGGGSVQYPAGYPGVISVAGVDWNGVLYPWATFGPWTAVSTAGCNETTTLGGGYTDFCGSSSSAAALSGAVALALSDVPSAAPRLRALLAAATTLSTRRLSTLGFLAAVNGAVRH